MVKRTSPLLLCWFIPLLRILVKFWFRHILQKGITSSSCTVNKSGARSFAINSLAISLTCYPLICYPNICYQTHLLSTQLRSHSFAIKPHLLSSLNCFRHICYQASLAIRPICNQSSIAINNFAINHHLLSNFRLALNPYFNQFFPLKIRKKFLKILEFFILWQTLRGHGTGSFCTNLLKDSNNYLYFHQKDLGKQYTGHLQVPEIQERMQSCSCSTKGIQRTGFDCNATYLGSNKFMIAT